MSTDSLLVNALEVAVPLWIEHWRTQPFGIREQRAKECAQIVAERGDIILFRSNKKGETAKAFNALAEGLALLSFAPGGVQAFGRRWETKP